MVLGDLLKHQSLSGICYRFVGSIRKKYNNNITVGEYIIERLINKNITVGFGYRRDDYNPIMKVINENDAFELVSNDWEEASGYCAISYAKYTGNIGLIIRSSNSEYANMCRPLNDARHNNIPLLLMSFYDQESEFNRLTSPRPTMNSVKEHYTTTRSEKFPNLMEYMMMVTEHPQKGPVHLNICNNIINDKVNLDTIQLDTTEPVWTKQDNHKNISSTKLLKQYGKEIPDLEDLSLLQYYEKHYEQLEQLEQLEQNKM